MKKLFGSIIWLLIIVIALAYVFRNPLVKFGIETGVKRTTGLDLTVGKVNIDLMKTKVGINDLKIQNPREFTDPIMFNAPEIFVDFKLSDLINKTIHLKEVRLNIDQLDIIKNKDGKMNINALQLKGNGQPSSGKNEPSTGTKKTPAPVENIKIDTVTLKIGKLIYKDYSQGATPKVKEINVNINETVNDVTNINSLAMLIFQKAMAKSAISDLIGINLDEGTQKKVQGILNAVGNLFKMPSK